MHAPIRYPFEEPPAEGAAIEVAPGILWIRMPLPMVLDHVNLYALEDGDGWALVDTGFSSTRCKESWETVLAGPLKGRPVTRMILTHLHPDHVGLAGWFADKGAEIVATRITYLTARMLTLDVQDVASAERITFYREAGMSEAMLAKRASERPFNFADVVDPIPTGFTRIRQGETLTIGDRDWTVEIGHGHAPSHATLWSGDLIIGGDQFLPSISSNIGVHPTEPAADPLDDWLRSCRRFQGLARDAHLVLGGHKLPFTGLPMRLRQLIENHENALDRLRAHLAEPRTAAECFTPIFGREIEGRAYGLALDEAIAHLNYLLNKGEVSRQMGDDGAWRWRTQG